jgi:hypothetical protein
MFGGVPGQRHGEVPRGFERDEQGGRRGAVSADDGDRRRPGQAETREGAGQLRPPTAQAARTSRRPGRPVSAGLSPAAANLC